MINFHSITLLVRKFFSISIFKLYVLRKLQQLYLYCFLSKYTETCMSLLQIYKHKQLHFSKLKNQLKMDKMACQYRVYAPIAI